MISSTRARPFKFSGRIAPSDTLHRITMAATPGAPAPDEHQLAPNIVQVEITTPPPTHWIGVPQYAETVRSTASQYNPAGDCSGYFMSSKFQPNNNCYAYGCNIATNTFPQPGRKSGYLITQSTLDGPSVAAYAAKDGLIEAGRDRAALASFAAARKQAAGSLDGHFVALMISAPDGKDWPGDYHWARCDDNVTFSSWSQKDGSDQVTNFDFAGNPISDPATANWQVNQGPIQPDKSQPDYNPSDLLIGYVFYCYMFVPNAGVDII